MQVQPHACHPALHSVCCLHAFMQRSRGNNVQAGRGRRLSSQTAATTEHALSVPLCILRRDYLAALFAAHDGHEAA